MIDQTLENFKIFIENAKAKHWINSNTAQNWRIVVSKVESLLEPSERDDLRLINLVTLFNKFKNRYHSELSASSLKIYKSRLSSALKYFADYTRDPSEFKGPSNSSKKSSQPSATNKVKKTQPIATPSVPVQQEGSLYYSFEIQLPKFSPARFHIPKGMQEKDWEMLKDVLKIYLERYESIKEDSP